MRKQAGFNLIEMLIVLAIIGILGSIGYGSYKGYMIDARRKAVISDLLKITTIQEKVYLDQDNYTDSLASLGATSTTGDGFYTISVSTDANGQQFTATATAVAGKAQVEDTGCTTISINYQNRKLPIDCW